MNCVPSDFQRLFEGAPGFFLVLRADAGFTIAAASDDYLQATRTDRSIFGRPALRGVSRQPRRGACHRRCEPARLARARAREQGRRHDGGAEVRHPPAGQRWGRLRGALLAPGQRAVLSAAGDVAYIVHRVEDATSLVRLERADTRTCSPPTSWRASPKASSALDRDGASPTSTAKRSASSAAIAPS